MRPMSNNHSSAKTRGKIPSKTLTGSVLPQKIREEIDEKEIDDTRKFGKRYVNRTANRKEQRKQERKNKGKRKFQHQQQLHPKPGNQPEREGMPEAKRQKKKESLLETNFEKKKLKTKKEDTNAKAMESLAKSNPKFFSLLNSNNLAATDSTAFDKDDREIAYWEKKLGMKKNQKLGKEFKDDGLLDILGSPDEDGKTSMDDQQYLAQKRAKQKADRLNAEAEEAMDDLFDGLDEEEETSDNYGDEDIDMDDVSENDAPDDDTMGSPGRSEESGDIEEKALSIKTAEATPSTRYIPPHLREANNSKSERQLRLQRLLQGLFNKLSEGNMESILWEMESCYRKYPRHDVTSTITDIILTAIAQKANLLDSFVIIYATVVASFYRLSGVEFAAHFIQTLVEMFEKNLKNSRETIDVNQDEEEEGQKGTKESKNLLTLMLELYNFQVVSCVLIYDLVKMLISSLDEHGVELLLKVLRTCGPQLRADDPTALKDIIDEIQTETGKKDPASISTRHRFMLETIANIKNNKIKRGPTASGVGGKDMVQKMKIFLTGLGKKRTLRSSEPLRVSLQDIHDIKTKGKWWIVGASWKDNMVGSENKHSASDKIAKDLEKDQSQQQTLLKLARKQGMNTDIRRSIFIAIMGAEDYVDAFDKLMKLSLTEVQQREIARVLLQCTGNEKTFNPFYMLVSRRLCELHHSFRITFQYCLWDFLRELGEKGVGGMDHSAEVEHSESHGHVRLSRVINVAKFYASLVANGSLTLAILKSIDFITLGNNGRIFLENMFAHMILQTKEAGTQAVADIFAKINYLETLALGCTLFIQETVIKCENVALSSARKEEEKEIVRWGCQIAKDELRKKKSMSFV